MRRRSAPTAFSRATRSFSRLSPGRGSGGGVVARQAKSMSLSNLSVPDSAQHGQTVGVTVTASNGALFRDPSDADSCDNSANPCPETPGVDAPTCTIVEFEMGGQTVDTGAYCHPGTLIGTWDETHAAQLETPGTGSSTQVTARLILPGSGTVADTVSETITLDSPNGNGGNGGNGDGLTPLLITQTANFSGLQVDDPSQPITLTWTIGNANTSAAAVDAALYYGETHLDTHQNVIVQSNDTTTVSFTIVPQDVGLTVGQNDLCVEVPVDSISPA